MKRFEEIVVQHGSISAQLWDKLKPLGVYHNGDKGSQLTIWVYNPKEGKEARQGLCGVCGQVLSEISPGAWRCEDCDRAR